MNSARKTNSWRGRSPRESGARGFSLIELMIVLSLFLIVAGIGFMALQPALKDAERTTVMRMC